MKYATLGAIAALLGQTNALQLTNAMKMTMVMESHSNEEVQVLMATDTHIEMGVKADTKVDAKTQSTAQVESSAKAEAHANMQMAAEAAPDVYGPNGDNYQNNNAYYDYSRIKIDIHQQGKGPKCRGGDWVSAHWVANLQQDGRVYSDTAQEGNGEPKVFPLGGHHVISCLDIAITQLTAGSKAHIECPSFYAYGGALTQSFLKGGLPLPLHADVEYELQIVDCNIEPEVPAPKPEPKKVGIQGNRQMSMHITKDMGIDLVLCCQDDDYLKDPKFDVWPGIQCYLEEYIKHDPNQLWVWDDQTYFLKNVATGFYLSITSDWHLIMGNFDHINWNVVDKKFPWYPQWFEFCPYEHTLESEMNGNAVYASVQPNIKLRNNIEIVGYGPKDTEEIIAKGVYTPQYEFKNW